MKAIIKFLAVAMVLLGTASVKAAPVDVATAKKVAAAQLQKISNGKNISIRSGQGLELVYEAKSEGVDYPLLYVINGEQGFVIVAGDDRAVQVLGYSDEGVFDPNNLPPALADIIQSYQDEIKWVVENDIEAKPIRKVNIRSGSVYQQDSILVKSIWKQSESPYNDKCPEQHAGCVPIAMAQIIRYWGCDSEYKNLMKSYKGIGSKTYTTTTNHYTLSADFGNTVYDFEQMPALSYDVKTTAQKDAISTLCFHCGVACEADYKSNETGILMTKQIIENAFKYFGFSNAKYEDKGVKDVFFGLEPKYNDEQWNELIKSEIDQKRPVLLSGTGYGTHSWVCDGYTYKDGNIIFHMNWGWSNILQSQYNNCWLSLNAISFSYQGYHNYSYYQSAVINIYPDIKDTPSNIIYITPEGAGTRDGKSWSNAKSAADLYTEMAKDRTDSMQIWVKAGTYFGNTSVGQGANNAAFVLGKGNKVYGGFAGNETSIEERTFQDSTFLDGQNARRVLCQRYDFANADSSFLDGLVLRNGIDIQVGSSNIFVNSSSGLSNINSGSDKTGNGGGAYLMRNGILRNCTIKNCKANSAGGVFNNGGKIIDCSFINNEAEHAGALCNYNGGYTSLSNSNIIGNKGTNWLAYGGALYNYNATMYINSGVIISNNSAVVGGGIYNSYQNGILIMNEGELSYNTAINRYGADGYGAGIYNDGTTTINGGKIKNNKAGLGGGITNHGILNLNNVVITNNIANSYGGGIAAGEGYVGVLNINSDNVKIQGNQANSYGGGIAVFGGTITIKGGIIGSDNKDYRPISTEDALANGGNVSLGYNGGGGICIGSNNVKCNFESSSYKIFICGNYAKHSGGGIWSYAGLSIPNNVVINSNVSEERGGGVNIAGSYGSRIILNGCTINNNLAEYGGGIAQGEYLFIYDNTTINYNESLQEGGGIWSNSYGRIYMMEGEISYNTAYNGGGISNEGDYMNIIGGIIKGNTANGYGAGIYNYDKKSYISGSANIKDAIYVPSSSYAVNIENISNPITFEGGYGYAVAKCPSAATYISNDRIKATAGLTPYANGNYIFLSNVGARAGEITDNETIKNSISIYPTNVSAGNKITVASPSKGTAYIWNLSGVLIGTCQVDGNTQIEAPTVSGTYVIKVVIGNENKEVKVIVK